MIVDLFAGAGGWDEGLQQVGYPGKLLGLDNDPHACAAAVAAGHPRDCIDIPAADPRQYGPVDGLLASPPCPSFSIAGKHGGFDDPRGLLTREPLRWARELLPRWIAFEQVPTVLPVWQADAAELETLGYSTWTGVLGAADYGTPQRRRRAILIARRDGIEAAPPASTGAEIAMADVLGWGMTARPYFTLAAARTSGGGPDKEKLGGSGARKALYRERAEGRWIDPPAPEHDGAIRVRIADAAVLMGFRRDYPWHGNMTQQYRQLSNAVCPPLAAAITAPLLAAQDEVAA